MRKSTNGAAQRPTRRRHVVLTFLCALSFLTYFDRVCLMRAQSDVQRDLALTNEQMGLVFAAFWFAYALFEIPGGWMGDRFGARVTLTRIVLAWSLFTALSGAAAGFGSLLTFRFLFGAGEAGAYPNMALVQARWLPARTRARAGGWLWLVARFGGALAPLLFGALLRLFDSPGVRGALASVGLPADLPAWRPAFVAAALVGAVWCVAFYPWFRDDPARMRSVNAAELRLIREGEVGVAAPAEHRAVWRALLTCRSLWALGGLYVLASFPWSFFVSWLPRYLHEVHTVSFSESELVSGLPLFCGGLACLAGGTLSDALVRRTRRKWLGRAVLPCCGYTLAAAAMVGVRYADSASEATALICLAAAAIDLGQGANWATIVDIGGRHAGTAAGFVNMVGNAGNYLQPYFGALIFQSLGWNALLAVYAAALLGAAGMWFFIDPNRAFDDCRDAGRGVAG
jgi:MFS family permease